MSSFDLEKEIEANAFLNKISPANKELRNSLLRNIKVFKINFEEIDCFIIDKEIYFVKEIETDLKKILEKSTQSMFGEKKDYVLDLGVRKAKEVKNISINFISKLIDASDQKKIQPYKLNIYEEGGLFATHLDTSRHRLSHTIVLFLETKFTGGELYFENVDYNFLPHDNYNCIMFPYYYPHEVKKVLGGNRVTITFNVYESFTPYIETAYDLLESEAVGNGVNDDDGDNDDDDDDDDDDEYPFSLTSEEKNNLNTEWLDEFFKNKENIICGVDNILVPTLCYFFKTEPDIVYSKACKGGITEDTDLYETMKVVDTFEEEVILEDYVGKPSFVIGKDPETLIEEYTYHYGYRGNSPCSTIVEAKYHKFYMFKKNTPKNLPVKTDKI